MSNKSKATGDKPWAEKDTPHLDHWKNELRKILTPRGKKTELATFIAKTSNRTLQHTLPIISRLVNTTVSPSAELLLSINTWTEKQKRSR
jgi:hypothetical protein